LSNVDAGAVQLRQGHDGTVRVEASDRLTMLDTRQGVTTTAVGHFSHLYLTLPEQVVIQALGADPARWHQPVQPLPNTGLFPFALAQMKMLAKNWKKLNRQEAAAAVHSTTQLALTGLRQLTVEKLDPEDNSATHALYNAACQYIERHAVTHQTAAVEIASRLGCSRAHLYRVFSAHNTTIGDVVRKANLDKAKWMLTKGRPLAHIAWETGYADAASFGRAFKKHLGMAPGEYRARYCRPPKV
jgi:AraC-like DNA-binding protein